MKGCISKLWHCFTAASTSLPDVCECLTHKDLLQAMHVHTHMYRLTPVDVGEGHTYFGRTLSLISNRLWMINSGAAALDYRSYTELQLMLEYI